MTTPAEIQRWNFPPRLACDPKAARAEWAWVVDWVSKEGLIGKCYAVRESTLDEDGSAVVSFTIYEGQTSVTDSNRRNL